MQEGIDSCWLCVKRKICDKDLRRDVVLFWGVVHVFEQLWIGSYQSEHHAGEEVVPTVRDHSWKQVSAQQRKHAKERAEDRDEEDAAQSFVSVGRAKDDSRDKDRDGRIAQQCDALRLKVAAKNKLFRKSDDKAEQAPCGNLNAVVRRQFDESFDHFRLLLLRALGLGRIRVGMWRGRLMLVYAVLNEEPG